MEQYHFGRYYYFPGQRQSYGRRKRNNLAELGQLGLGRLATALAFYLEFYFWYCLLEHPDFRNSGGVIVYLEFITCFQKYGINSKMIKPPRILRGGFVFDFVKDITYLNHEKTFRLNHYHL